MNAQSRGRDDVSAAKMLIYFSQLAILLIILGVNTDKSRVNFLGLLAIAVLGTISYFLDSDKNGNK